MAVVKAKTPFIIGYSSSLIRSTASCCGKIKLLLLLLLSVKIMLTMPKGSDSVIDVKNINTFKNKLDKLWVNEEVKFNWRYDLPVRNFTFFS